MHAQLQRAHQIERATDYKTLLGRLGGIEKVVGAVVAPATVIWSVGAEVNVAQFLAPHGPVHEVSVRRIGRPLPR
jgi:hypothetical protein